MILALIIALIWIGAMGVFFAMVQYTGFNDILEELEDETF